MAETEAIPDSIMKAAGSVVADIVSDTRIMTMGEIDAAALPIARALMAERLASEARQKEADARIAETAYESRNLADRSPRHIASLIRK